MLLTSATSNVPLVTVTVQLPPVELSHGPDPVNVPFTRVAVISVIAIVPAVRKQSWVGSAAPVFDAPSKKNTSAHRLAEQLRSIVEEPAVVRGREMNAKLYVVAEPGVELSTRTPLGDVLRKPAAHVEVSGLLVGSDPVALYVPLTLPVPEPV